ncbi:hypothetical protein ATANTOWER_003086 [Ataeniobius toweri]|uniref:Uncharacterized protein n=1 Tax=Ataeniobius toweri TaxID=208326 RepID=A0ABU7BYJ9_9TELE|nr:hypothetical protein [Ataeniobius toweri]
MAPCFLDPKEEDADVGSARSGEKKSVVLQQHGEVQLQHGRVSFRQARARRRLDDHIHVWSRCSLVAFVPRCVLGQTYLCSGSYLSLCPGRTWSCILCPGLVLVYLPAP